MTERSVRRRVVGRVVRELLRRPDLWGVAVHQAFRLARPRWWATAPFLPLPDPAYVRFRALTAYGSADHEPDPVDVVTYLEWCRDLETVVGS